jgi:hypothetical protein
VGSVRSTEGDRQVKTPMHEQQRDPYLLLFVAYKCYTIVTRYHVTHPRSDERWRVGVALCNTTHTSTLLLVTLLVAQQ